MSMQGFRVRTASEARFLPETENRPAVAYVRLVEDTWIRHDDGTFSEGEPNWFDGKFTGKQAELIGAMKVGTALIVLGTTREVTKESDGRNFTNVQLSVKTFGKDEAFTKMPETGQGVSHSANQDTSADQDTSAANTATARDASPAPDGAEITTVEAAMEEDGWPVAELGQAPEGSPAAAPGFNVASIGKPGRAAVGCWESPRAMSLHGYQPPQSDYTIATTPSQAGSPTVIAQVSHTTVPGM